MAHTREELRRFQDGETRMVFARRRDNPQAILWMEDGKAREMREMTRSELMCIVEGCESPDLKTVARSKAREGFSHLSGGGHAGMGIHHMQSQLIVERWVRHRYPETLEVQAEYTTEDRARRADIMVTSKGTGRRVAIEIQYAGLSVEDWRLRHDSYKSMEIGDTWIFGHAGAQFCPVRGSVHGEVRLNPTHEAVIACGSVPLWLNPVTAEVAWAVDPYDGQKLARGGEAILCIRPLAEFTLALDGLHHRELDAVRKRSADIWAQEQREKEERARQHAIQAQEIERRRAAQEAQARATKERHERIAARSAASRAQWIVDGGQERARGEFDGFWPQWLSFANGLTLHVPDEQWQSRLYLKLIRKAPTGKRIPLESLVSEFIAEFGAGECLTSEITDVLREWVRNLVRHQILGMKTVRGRKHTDYAVWVLAPKNAERRQQVFQEAESGGRTDAQRGAMSGRTSDHSPSMRVAHVTMPEPLVCQKCGKKLDDALREQGVHIGCETGWRAGQSLGRLANNFLAGIRYQTHEE